MQSNPVEARKEEAGDVEMEPVKLDPLPADPWLVKELENSIKDNAFAPQDMVRMGDELKRVKQEFPNSPTRSSVPLPPSKLSEVVEAVRALQESKPKSNKTSICAYTLHNTYEG